MSEMEHILEIQTNLGRSFISLNKETYTLGRSLRNSIVIKDAQVSRYHATLVRTKKADLNEYYYTIYDGNCQNKKSSNGIIINNKLCTSWVLENNDLIQLGDNVKLKYYHCSDRTLNLLKISYKHNSSAAIFVDEEADTVPFSGKQEQEVDNTPSFIKKTLVNLDSSSFAEQLKVLSERYNVKY